jgi:hypothetical protein
MIRTNENQNNETEISMSTAANPWKPLPPENAHRTNAELTAENYNQDTEFGKYKGGLNQAHFDDQCE